MTRRDNERQRAIRDKIIKENKELSLEEQIQIDELRNIIIAEKILKLLFLTPLLIGFLIFCWLMFMGLLYSLGWI